MYLSILRMSCHALGLLLATILCCHLCQGEIEFFSDDTMCSKNGTIKSASIKDTASVIFCVTLGPRDVLSEFVVISHSPEPLPTGKYYQLNERENQPVRVSSVTSPSYTTVNITFTSLETGDFNKKFYVSIYKKPPEEKFKVWFILIQETAVTSETRDIIPDDQPKEVNRFLDIGVTAVIVLILCTTTGSLIYCCRRRTFRRSRQAISVNIQEAELPRQNEVLLLPTVANIPGQPTGSGHGDSSRGRPTCPVDLSSPYTQYEEIRNVETGSRDSSSVPASRAFSDIQREQVEFEISVQGRARDGTPDCYVELMDDPSGVSEKLRDGIPDCYVELMDDPSGVPKKPRDGTLDCYVELMDDPSAVSETVSSASKEISQFSNVVEYENTLPVL